jgi:hypothetical protein
MYVQLQADKGFNIAAECESRLISLDIPPGKRGSAQLSTAAVNRTKRIANQRILVEQVIRRIKTFRILQSELPVELSRLRRASGGVLQGEQCLVTSSTRLVMDGEPTDILSFPPAE